MSLINLNNLQSAIALFVDTQVIPNLPAEKTITKFIFAGSSAVMARTANNVITPYIPILKGFGLVNDHNQLDTQLVKLFLDSGFQKEPNLQVPVLGMTINFTQEDGKALLEILETFKE